MQKPKKNLKIDPFSLKSINHYTNYKFHVSVYDKKIAHNLKKVKLKKTLKFPILPIFGLFCQKDEKKYFKISNKNDKLSPFDHENVKKPVKYEVTKNHPFGHFRTTFWPFLVSQSEGKVGDFIKKPVKTGFRKKCKKPLFNHFFDPFLICIPL